jgi:uncharacterized membrane protein
MMETLIQWFTTTLVGLISKELTVFIISMVPVLELRGGLIAAKLMGIPLLEANLLCIIGNIIPVPFILLFITPIFTRLKQTKLFRPMVEKLENKAMNKKDQVEKYEFFGLMLFVGIPLPGTGAWTGSLVASMLNIPFKKAFPATILGIFMAAVIIDIISYGLLGLFF